ncbi:MAG: hypothetical protein WA875_03140, partial [Candidatus Acidiferrales bacterium]
LKLSFSVQRYFSDPESRARLSEQIGSLPADEREGYVQTLGAVIEETNKAGLAPDSGAIFTYMQLTAERQQSIASNKEALRAQRWQAVEISLGVLMLIALFSLILVLLAIERNTRSNKTVILKV